MTWRTLAVLAVLVLAGCGGPPAGTAGPTSSSPLTAGGSSDAAAPRPPEPPAADDAESSPAGSPVTSPPATSPPSGGGTGRWRVAMWGDSIAADAGWALAAAFVEVSGRRPYLALVDRTRIGDHVGSIERFGRVFAADPPEVAVVALGTGDARDNRPAGTVRSEVARVRSALRDVPCVLWVDVKAAGVNGIYAGVVAYAGWVNVVLRSELDGRPGIERLDVTRWAARHPDAFLADGLHFNADGAVRYAWWLAGRAQRCVEALP